MQAAAGAALERRETVKDPFVDHFWGVGLHNGGIADVHVSATRLRARQSEVEAFESWCWEVQDRMHGRMQVTVIAGSEAEALERGSHLFCQAAGVWSVSELLSWSEREYREWRTMRDAELAAEAQAREAPDEPAQLTLF